MKKLILLGSAVGVLAAVPAGVARTPAQSTCKGTEYRSETLKVHGITCKDAARSIQTGSKAFRCRQHGKRLPILITCTSRQHPSETYSWEFRGG